MPLKSLPVLPPVANRLPAPVSRRAGDDGPAAVCAKVFEEICVLANGDIVCSSCDVNGRWVYGNVHTDRIADVFNGPRYREMREWHLRSRPDSWCPAIDHHCPMRTPLAGAEPSVTDCRVKVLKIEPVTHCNLHCPVCPVETHFVHDPAVRARRARKILPLEAMINVVEQLPDIQTLLYYNFGEPLLHKDTVPFLRAVRRLRPNCWLATNTNGIPLTPAATQAIAAEALFDKIVFSIDGAAQESYKRYRVGGDWERAMAKMTALAEACRAAGTAGRVNIVWQYILFDWNDGDEELLRAKELAARIGIPIEWMVTNGEGASKRFFNGSEALARLVEGSWSGWKTAAHTELVNRFERERGDGALRVYQSVPVTCLLADLGDEGDGHRAHFWTDEPEWTTPPGVTVGFSIRVTNRSDRGWDDSRPDRLRFGVSLRPLPGGELAEVSGGRFPPAAATPDGSGAAAVNVTLPAQPGDYELLLDVVHEGVCWFHHKGSEPLVCRVKVAA